MNKVAFIGVCLVLSNATAGPVDGCQQEPLCIPLQSDPCIDLTDQSIPFPGFGVGMELMPNETFFVPQECCGDEPCCDECTCHDEDAECENCSDSNCECDCGCDCCCRKSGNCTAGGIGGVGACGFAGGGYGGGFGGGGFGSGFGSGALSSLAPLAAGLLSGRSSGSRSRGGDGDMFGKRPRHMDPMSMMKDPPTMPMNPPMSNPPMMGGGGRGGVGKPAAVPEPSSVILLATGAAGIGLRRYRKKKA